LIHIKKLSKKEKEFYGFHSQYFISDDGWSKWSENLKVNAILEYLGTIRIDVVWKSTTKIITMLNEEKLLSKINIDKLEESIYSHNVNGVHLIRIPLIFWTLYSSKKDRRIEDVIRTENLSTETRIIIGKYVIDRVKAKYPDWKAIKHIVPGEVFTAVNYPPELSSIVFSAVNDWGKLNQYW